MALMASGNAVCYLVADMPIQQTTKRTIGIILLTMISTLAVALIAFNFKGNETNVERRIDRIHALSDAGFMKELGVMLGPPFVGGNRAQALINGDEIFPAMLADIRSAQASITFETYIYWSGAIGQQFADALAERAKHGVKVHVLLDWVGSAKMEDALLDEMRQAGVQIHRFHPPHWTNLGRMNNRTHRKLLVVDGRVGYTGGGGLRAGREGS